MSRWGGVEMSEGVKKNWSKERVRRIVAQGGRSLQLVLPPNSAHDLALETARTGETATATMIRLLRENRERLQGL